MPKKRANVSVGPVKPRQKQRMSSAKSTATTQRSGGAGEPLFLPGRLRCFAPVSWPQKPKHVPWRNSFRTGQMLVCLIMEMRWFLIYLYIWIYRGDIYNILFIYFCITSVRWYPMQKETTKEASDGRRDKWEVNGCAKASRDSEKPSGFLRASAGRPGTHVVLWRPCEELTEYLWQQRSWFRRIKDRTTDYERGARQPVLGRKIVNAETPA